LVLEEFPFAAMPRFILAAAWVLALSCSMIDGNRQICGYFHHSTGHRWCHVLSFAIHITTELMDSTFIPLISCPHFDTSQGASGFEINSSELPSMLLVDTCIWLTHWLTSHSLVG
jgi:hypothetical protein